MQIQPPDAATPVWQYVVYVFGTIVLAVVLIPPVRRAAVAQAAKLKAAVTFKPKP